MLKRITTFNPFFPRLIAEPGFPRSLFAQASAQKRLRKIRKINFNKLHEKAREWPKGQDGYHEKDSRALLKAQLKFRAQLRLLL